MKYKLLIFSIVFIITACSITTPMPSIPATATEGVETAVPSTEAPSTATAVENGTLNNPEFLAKIVGNEQIAKFNETHTVYKISDAEYGTDVKDLTFKKSETDGNWYAHVTMGADMESNIHDWSIPSFQVRENGDVWAGMSMFSKEGNICSCNMETVPAGDLENNLPWITVIDSLRDEFGRAYETYESLVDPTGDVFAKAKLNDPYIELINQREFPKRIRKYRRCQ